MADALDEYRRKRDFSVTSEPKGLVSARRGQALAFVIHMHGARRVHFDLRLELDGVLKSWAVTKHPSLDPAVKRLAVEVEDHPLAYGAFEGIIPKGEYGAGPVLIWDRGEWTPDDPHDVMGQLTKGELKFSLKGEKLNAPFVLVRMKPRARETRPQWLLIAHKAGGIGAPTEPFDDRSVVSGRTLEDILKGKAAPRSRSTGIPDFVPPALCRLVDAPPASNDWGHEVKFDGYRLQLRVVKGRPTVRSRNGHDWTHRFPDIAKAAERLPDCLLDGEAILSDKGGDFAALHKALAAGRSEEPIRLMLFDCLFLDDRDLRPLPLSKRREALQRLPLVAPALQRVEMFRDDGPSVFRAACALGLEGIVSKRLNAPYRSGRSDDWVKTKCIAFETLALGGVVLDKNRNLKALLVGKDEAGALIYEGRVGTGFKEPDRVAIADAVARWETPKSPFAPHTALKSRPGEDLVWVKPELSVDINVRGRTDSGQLRHASFKTLHPKAGPPEPAKPHMRSGRAKSSAMLGINLTNPDKALWPEEEGTPAVTKRDLAQYLIDAAPLLLREIAGRPVSLVRCPDGITGQHFFQRHSAAGMGNAIKAVVVEEARKPYLQIDTAEGLVAAAQSAAIEFHPWNCAPGRPEIPGRLVFDLDPDPEVAFSAVVKGALEVRDRLAALGLAGYCKTTGGKGLHVTVPLIGEGSDWPKAKAFALAVCRAMAADSPQRYTTTLAKKARHGRIFLDYLRNDRMATAVAAYSPRARPGAPVSMPIPWSAVKPDLNPRAFTIATALKRRADPWPDYEEAARPLP